MTVLSKILTHKIVAIIRGAAPQEVLKIARALQEGGIGVMEITLNSPDALTAIGQVAAAMGDLVAVGAGTVLNAGEAEAAIAAGATFIISPVLDLETIRVTKQLDAVSIPGAFTATEILTAHRQGADIIKVFPASVGVGYFRDLRGPLPRIPLMPTGGVNLGNIREYQKVGAVAFGVGSALVDTSQPVTEAYLQQLTEKARQYVEAVNG